jgi:ankyrin repeat protein
VSVILLLALFAFSFGILVSRSKTEEWASFEWNSNSGFSRFEFKSQHDGPRTVLGVKNRVDRFLRAAHYSRARGQVEVTILRPLPYGYPTALGAGGIDIEDPDQTALMKAALTSNESEVDRLISNGENVNAKDQAGQGALLLACLSGNLSPHIVNKMISAGADVNAQDKRGRTPLRAVVSAPVLSTNQATARLAVVKILLDHGADPNIADQLGTTPLMGAAERNEIDETRFLLSVGADPSYRDKSGRTASSIASEKRFEQLRSLFETK